MTLWDDLINIINEVCFNGTKEKELINHIELNDETNLLIILNDIFIRFSLDNNELILEDIVLSTKLKGKKLCLKLLQEIINYCKNSKLIKKFKVQAIVCSRLYNICDYCNMKDIPRYNYGSIDEQLYDFDGFYGDKEIDV